jgi:hypothetical protein
MIMFFSLLLLPSPKSPRRVAPATTDRGIQEAWNFIFILLFVSKEYRYLKSKILIPPQQVVLSTNVIETKHQ